MTTNKDGEIRGGTLVAVTLILLMVLPPIYLQFSGHESTTGYYEGVWALIVSIVFFSAYICEKKSWLFRGIMWIMRNIHVPRGEWFAIVYGGLFAIIAFYYFGLSVGVFG